MVLSEKEKTALRAVGKNSLLTISDMKKVIGDGTEYIINRLIDKKLISEVRPIGTICYVITAKGSKALRDIE